MFESSIWLKLAESAKNLEQYNLQMKFVLQLGAQVEKQALPVGLKGYDNVQST